MNNSAQIQVSDPLSRFRQIEWNAAPQHWDILNELVRLDLASTWPEGLKSKKPEDVLRPIFQACQAFSRGRLTVRSFDRWIAETAQFLGKPTLKSAYHRVTGRLTLNREEAALILECLFRRWGLISRPVKNSGRTSHGWNVPSEEIYFGIPVDDYRPVRDRLLAEIFPLIKADPKTFRIEDTKVVVSRFNAILGPPRGWALQAFHRWAREELVNSSGTLVFVVDLGKLRSSELNDFHAIYNVLELNAAMLALAVFDSDENKRPTVSLERGKPAWTTKADPKNQSRVLKRKPWRELQSRICISVHGLPEEIKTELLEKAKASFVERTAKASNPDQLIVEALRRDQYRLSIEHVFPRAEGVTQATLRAAGLPDVDFLALNVWIEQPPNEITSSSGARHMTVTHSFLWTQPNQRGLTTTEKAGDWWEAPQQYAGATDRRPFQEAQCEAAFSMVQQAAQFKISRKLSDIDREIGLLSLAYLSEKLDLSMMTLDEFAQLPSDLYRKHRHAPRGTEGQQHGRSRSRRVP